MKKIFLYSINNVFCGSDKKDSAKPKEEVIEEIKALAKFGVSGFYLFTPSLDSNNCEYVAALASSIKAKLSHIFLIACGNRANIESLKYLKANGIDSYNHNLESVIYSDLDSRIETCQNILSAGLKLCSGVIFGLGENMEQRIELLKLLKDLNPYSSSINFFIPKKTSLALKKNEALECIILAREILRDSILILADGREEIFNQNQKEIFTYGIDAIVLRDCINTEILNKDLLMLRKYNLKIGHILQDRHCGVV